MRNPGNLNQISEDRGIFYYKNNFPPQQKPEAEEKKEKIPQ